tara:strand:+ start:723 stop:1649 length:927 start_codon:yes stop_codon:yes gene_type:complete
MAIIIFGGSGFIGTNLINKLKNKETIYSINSKYIYLINKKSNIKINLKKITRLLKKDKFIEAYFCSSVRYDFNKYKNKPLNVYKKNILMMINFIQFFSKFEIKKITMISSYAVYGHNRKSNCNENEIIDKNYFSKGENFYALAKHNQEQLFISFCEQINLEYNIIRLPSIFGENSSLLIKNAHVIPSLIMKLLKKPKKLDIYGTGNEEREFIYVGDLIEFLLIIRKVKPLKIINFGSSKFLKIKDLSNILKQKISPKTILYFNNKSISDVPIRFVSNKKLLSIFNKFQFTNFDSAINKTISWYKMKYK